MSKKNELTLNQIYWLTFLKFATAVNVEHGWCPYYAKFIADRSKTLEIKALIGKGFIDLVNWDKTQPPDNRTEIEFVHTDHSGLTVDTIQGTLVFKDGEEVLYGASDVSFASFMDAALETFHEEFGEI